MRDYFPPCGPHTRLKRSHLFTFLLSLFHFNPSDRTPSSLSSVHVHLLPLAFWDSVACPRLLHKSSRRDLCCQWFLPLPSSGESRRWYKLPPRKETKTDTRQQLKELVKRQKIIRAKKPQLLETSAPLILKNFSYQKLSLLGGLVIRREEVVGGDESTSASLNIQPQPPTPRLASVSDLSWAASSPSPFHCSQLFTTASVCKVLYISVTFNWNQNMTLMWILYLRLHICRSSEKTLAEGHMWNLHSLT